MSPSLQRRAKEELLMPDKLNTIGIKGMALGLACCHLRQVVSLATFVQIVLDAAPMPTMCGRMMKGEAVGASAKRETEQ